MAGLQDAQQRLERAITRLEAALEGSEGRQRAAVAQPDAERGPDIDELVRALDLAQQENAALSSEQENAARHLDRIIGRLQRLLARTHDGHDGHDGSRGDLR